MIRRPPSSTLFPYTPLSRSKAASSFASGIIREPLSGVDAHCPVAPTTRMWVQSPRRVIDNLIVGHEAAASRFTLTRSINRSEEHTSELQSQSNLVCRLLLET